MNHHSFENQTEKSLNACIDAHSAQNEEANNNLPVDFFTQEILHSIEKHHYRTIAAAELEGREVVKNIIQACLLDESDEHTPEIFEIIDHEAEEYRTDFFEEESGKLVKNVAAVELLFDLTHEYETTPLLAQAIELRKGVPKQTNVVEAEHIIRLLVLNELKATQ